jgi:hypothetical protein
LLALSVLSVFYQQYINNNNKTQQKTTKKAKAKIETKEGRWNSS